MGYFILRKNLNETVNNYLTLINTDGYFEYNYINSNPHEEL